MRFASWINKATDTIRIFNTAFQRKQWLRERALILYLSARCLFCSNNHRIVFTLRTIRLNVKELRLLRDQHIKFCVDLSTRRLFPCAATSDLFL
jgi:hypothetical protein